MAYRAGRHGRGPDPVLRSHRFPRPHDEMNEATQDQPLLAPARVGDLELSNRMVMAPMTRSRAGEQNVPTDLVAAYYAQRASAGLIVTEATPIEARAHGYPGIPGLHTDRQEAGWKKATEAVHRVGGRIFSQLWHCGRVSHPRTQPDGRRPVAPSEVRPEGTIRTGDGAKSFVPPRALEPEEVEEVVDRFRRAARRARSADFDGVELHGANGYLVDQFLRDGTNRRDDRWGGSIENRVRFLAEVTDALAGVWGPGRVGVRLSPLNPYNDMEDSDPAATFGAAAEALGERDIAYLHLVEPDRESHEGEEHPVVTRMREAFGGTVILNGGYDRESANRAIREGRADLVSFGKLFLANPDLPERFARGLPLNEPDPQTFYGGGAEGYIDYPTWEEQRASAS